MAEESKSWWQTLPGILTATAGIITAVAGLVVALHQSGIFDGEEKPTSQPSAETTEPSTDEPIAITPAPTPPKPIEKAEVNTDPSSSAVKSISPPAQTQPTVQTQQKRINLIASENGGQIVVASSQDWQYTIDGEENVTLIGNEAVYTFRDERAATFDTFRVLIPETSDLNLKEFELLVGDDSPTGQFDSIGKFQTQNLRFFKDPYQEFKFPTVRAKYLKIKVISSFWNGPRAYIYEFQLLGSLDER